MQTTLFERAAVAFVARGIVGFMYLFEGASKVFGLGLMAYATSMTQDRHMAFYFPGWAIFPVALLTAVLDLVAGAMLVLGVQTRWAARILGALVVLSAAGYGLAGLIDPVGGITAMDTRAVNTYLIPRVALLAVVLMLPPEDDLLTVDELRGRTARLSSRQPRRSAQP